MQPNYEQRLAANEVVFRDINERIEAGRWPGEGGDRLAFRCECSALGCNVLVELTIAEYERVRAHPRHFLLAHGHQTPAVEVVVDEAPGFIVVEKVGEAGRTAERADPRDD